MEPQFKVGQRNQMPGSNGRITLIGSLLALAAAGAGSIWYLQRPESPTTADATANITSGDIQNSEVAPPRADFAPVSNTSPVNMGDNDGFADETPTAMQTTSGAPRIRASTPQLKPYVALALTETSKTTEELCPELAQQGEGGSAQNSGDAAKSNSDAKGCVLPIGGEEPVANVQQAAIPLESGRPPVSFPKKGVNFLPLVGGLGAAVSSFPIISGLSDNKDSSQPLSPN